MKNATNLTSLCLLTLLIGCAECPVVVKTETVTLEKEVLVPVPKSLTKQVEVPPMPDNLDTIGLGVLYKITLTRLLIANGRLKEIEGLK